METNGENSEKEDEKSGTTEQLVEQKCQFNCKNHYQFINVMTQEQFTGRLIKVKVTFYFKGNMQLNNSDLKFKIQLNFFSI